MTVDLSSYKVAASELSSSTKFDNLVQAIQDALNALPPSQLVGYPSDATKVLKGDGSWAVPPSTAPGFGTALPGSPVDGDLFILVDSTSAPTYSWLLRYVAAKASNKWVCIGGAPLYAEVVTSEGTASTSYTALATAGPSIVLPVAGDYFVANGCHITASATSIPRMSYDIGGTGAVDADNVQAEIASGGSDLMSVSRKRKKTGLTAVTLTSKYKTNTGTGTFANRWIEAMPIALGG